MTNAFIGCREAARVGAAGGVMVSIIV